MPDDGGTGKDGAPRNPSLRELLTVYRNRRILAVFLMGVSSGLPLLLGFSTLSFWLSTVGIDKTTIGLFALVATPYSFKFVWAPLLDHLAPPPLLRRLGQRRGWIVATQIVLAGAIVVLGASDPAGDLELMALAAIAVAFASASQDIVIDAYRIDVLEDHEQGAGAAATQAGYRIGLVAAGAGALALSDVMSWSWVYAIMASLVSIGVVGVAIGPEPAGERTPAAAPVAGLDRLARLRGFMERAVLQPFVDFMTRPAWIAILLFVLLYKFGDAIGAVMSNPFYAELGFSGSEIGFITKGLGVAATLLGVFLGGVLVARYGLFRALLVGGVLQAVTNLLFAVQAVAGHDIYVLAVVISGDNLTGGLGSAAFVAYLSSLCNARFTATQYALLTSFMAFGRTALSSGGGWLADQVSWVEFFVGTTLLALPGLLLLAFLARAARQAKIGP